MGKQQCSLNPFFLSGASQPLGSHAVFQIKIKTSLDEKVIALFRDYGRGCRGLNPVSGVEWRVRGFASQKLLLLSMSSHRCSKDGGRCADVN
jgi:hypothetical protein